MTNADADNTELRAVRPSLRAQNRERTRQRILEACADIELVHGGMQNPEVFTYAKVAEVAGVSERTVYRMFPTKQDLTHAYVTDRVLAGGREYPMTVAEYPDFLRIVSQEWTARLPGPVPGYEHPAEQEYPDAIDDRRYRDDLFMRVLDDVVPRHLPDRQRRAIVAALHSAVSLRTLILSAARWGLTLAEAGEAQAWALETLIDSLRTKEPPPWETSPPPSPHPHRPR